MCSINFLDPESWYIEHDPRDNYPQLSTAYSSTCLQSQKNSFTLFTLYALHLFPGPTGHARMLWSYPRSGRFKEYPISQLTIDTNESGTKDRRQQMTSITKANRLNRMVYHGTRDMRKTCLNTNRWAVKKRFAIALTVFAVVTQCQIGPASVGKCKRAGPPNTGILFRSNEVLKNIIFKKRIA